MVDEKMVMDIIIFLKAGYTCTKQSCSFNKKKPWSRISNLEVKSKDLLCQSILKEQLFWFFTMKPGMNSQIHAIQTSIVILKSVQAFWSSWLNWKQFNRYIKVTVIYMTKHESV